MQYLTLSNETKMPIIGLGTWKSAPADVYSAIRWGLKLGYSHFDCASIYNNEEAIGQALSDAQKEDGLKRENFFITSKLWNNAHRPEDVIPALKESLTKLQTPYLDLYLMHWPVAQKKDALMPLVAEDMLPLNEIPLAETWEAVTEAYEQGLVKAIGVSNFGIKTLTELMMTAKLNPMVNQYECHPYLPQQELTNWCHSNNIAVTAYAPLGSGTGVILNDPVIGEIAAKNNVSPAEICLAWNIARNVAVIPKATSEHHLKQNISASNVKLDEDDLKKLNTLNKNERFLNADVFKIGPYAGSDVFA